MKQQRTQYGASLALVVGVTIVLAIVGIVIIVGMLTLSSGEQAQNQNNAGTLGTARSALNGISVPLPPGDPQQFSGVSDNGNIDVLNFNRVVAQAFVVAANAQDMSLRGQDNGATSHSQRLVNAANSVADALSKALTDPTKTNKLFQKLITANNPNPSPTTPSSFKTTGTVPGSFVDRGDPSNVFIDPTILPQNATLKAVVGSSTGSSTIAGDITARMRSQTTVAGSSTHLPDSQNLFFVGYQNPATAGFNFTNLCFLPMTPNSQPRLLSQAEFSAASNQSSPAPSSNKAFSWSHSIPNALGMSQNVAISPNGSLQSGVSSLSEVVNSYAVIEPITDQAFAASIPTGFIRIRNGQASPAYGSAPSGTEDAFTFTMTDSQLYVTDKTGNPLPYLISVQTDPSDLGGASGAADYLSGIINANKKGGTPDCSALNVGFALKGDTLGMGGVSPENCKQIFGVQTGGQGPGGSWNNLDLAEGGSRLNQDMARFHLSDPKSLWARPVIENAYDIPAPAPVSSGTSSVNVADLVNLDLLSQRAEGATKCTVHNYQSGISSLPGGCRGPLPSPNYQITSGGGALLSNVIPSGGAVWNNLLERCREIDPAFTGTSLSGLLSSNYIPLGKNGLIYKPQGSAPGVLALKEEYTALSSDGSFLKNYYLQLPDGVRPVAPTQISSVALRNDCLIDVSGDWSFPHPWDGELINVCVYNWFAWIPSSGFNNLLGEITMGAFDANCATCPIDGSLTFTINYGGTSGDTVIVPTVCDPYIYNPGYTGPC